MSRIGYIFGTVAIILIFNLETNNAVIFKLTNFECQSYNQSWITINNCRLKVIKRNRIGAYFNGTILYPAKDILVHYQYFKRASGYKPWLMKGKVDVCRYRQRPYDPQAILIVNLFLEFSNFNHTCPFYGVQLLNGFYLRPEVFRLPFPTGDYKLSLSWYFDKKLQFETNASFAFVENLIDQ